VDWQQPVSIVIVAVAAGALIWRRFRRRKFSSQRDTHCGCSAAGSQRDAPTILFKVRKGERPEMLVRVKQERLRRTNA